MYNLDETNIIELKERLNDSLSKEIVAFINTDGGTIFIGIRKDKKIVSIKTDIDEIQRRISDVINDQVSPRCREYVHQYVEVMEGKQVIVIDVKSDHANLYYIKKYGSDAFEISENLLVVNIPYNKFMLNQNLNEPKNEPKKTYEELIIELIVDNPYISKSEMAIAINVSRSTITRTIAKSNKIAYIGSKKSGYWKVND